MGRGTTPHSCRALVAVPHQNFSRTYTNHFLQPRWTKFSSSLWSQITLSLIIVYYIFFFFNSLVAEHDAEGNKCRDGVYIMATRASGKITAFDWSPCSRNYITNFLQ